MTKKWQICRIWTFLKTVWILGYCVNRLWESSACHVQTELASSQELVCLNSITGLLHLVIPWLKSLGLWFCSHSNLIISSFSPNLLLFTNSTTIPHCCPNHRTVSLTSGYQGHPFSFKQLQNCFTHSLFHLNSYSLCAILIYQMYFHQGERSRRLYY